MAGGVFVSHAVQWLAPLWQSPGPRGQILCVHRLLQGLHHPPGQQRGCRARARDRAWAWGGSRLRGVWTGAWLRALTGHGDHRRCPLHPGTPRQYRVWVSVWECGARCLRVCVCAVSACVCVCVCVRCLRVCVLVPCEDAVLLHAWIYNAGCSVCKPDFSAIIDIEDRRCLNRAGNRKSLVYTTRSILLYHPPLSTQ